MMLLRLWRSLWTARDPFAGRRETPSEAALVSWLRGGR